MEVIQYDFSPNERTTKNITKEGKLKRHIGAVEFCVCMWTVINKRREAHL